MIQSKVQTGSKTRALPSVIWVGFQFFAVPFPYTSSRCFWCQWQEWWSQLWSPAGSKRPSYPVLTRDGGTEGLAWCRPGAHGSEMLSKSLGC